MKQTELPRLKIKLDWREYYRKFSEQHGGYPIIYKGRQLFQDGWTYSLDAYQGPEWPPPKDEREIHKLQQAYWYIRWSRAKNELKTMEAFAYSMRELQDNKSAPLQHIVQTQDEATGKVIRSTEDYTPRTFDYVLKFLQLEVQECSEHLEELRIKSESFGKSPQVADA